MIDRVSSGGPDLFVVCKSCKAEVSPYITECPYCGARLRKSAPKLDRQGRVREPRRARRKGTQRLSLGPLRPGEIPGIRPDRRPYATLALVGTSLVGALLWRTGLLGLHSFVLAGDPHGEWWRVATTPFTYVSTGYAFVALTALAVFGWLLERRHGALVVLALFVLGGMGGAAVAAAVEADPVALGANGAALALLSAWAIPDLRAARRGHEIDGDLLGVAAFAAVLLLLPVAIVEADALAGLTGVLAGLAVGLPLASSRRG
jgi:membrane associated rhomboid family serine protease